MYNTRELMSIAYVISKKISCAGPYLLSLSKIGDIFVWFDLRLYTNKCAKNNCSTIPEK